MKIQYICNAIKWFDKVNGNTYYSVRVTRCKDGKQIVHPYTYGYGSSYEQTTHEIVLKEGWIPAKYKDNVYLYERENNYPISYNVSAGLKKDCVANGVI